MMDLSTQFLVYLEGLRTPLGLSFFTRLTEFGSPAVVAVVLAVSVFVFWRGKAWAHALGLMVALGGGIVVAEILKITLKFQRPDLILHAVVENGYSFPSGHSTGSMALYGFLAWCVWEKYPRWRIVATIFFGTLILGIGFSRLYLGVHFPADVLGGYLLGFLFLVLGVRITRYLEKFEDLSSFIKNRF